MSKNVWCAPLLLLALGCGDDPDTLGTTQKQEEQGPHACTDIGCTDQLNVELDNGDAAWPSGIYELTLTVDGQANVCAFAIPKALPTLGSVTVLSCKPPEGAAPAAPVELMIAQRVTCTEHNDGQTVSQSCDPIPDRHDLRITVPGTPVVVGLDLTRDGAAVLQRTYEPTYEASRPNGPQCEPLCNQARIEETL